MDSAGVGNLISTVTALIAIGGLIYQSRSTRKQLKLQNFVEYTKRYQQILLNLPESIHKAEFSVENFNNENTMRYMRAYFDLCFEEYILHEKQFIDDDLWLLWEKGMRDTLAKSAFQKAWNKIKEDTMFGNRFEDFVQNTIIR